MASINKPPNFEFTFKTQSSCFPNFFLQIFHFRSLPAKVSLRFGLCFQRCLGFALTLGCAFRITFSILSFISAWLFCSVSPAFAIIHSVESRSFPGSIVPVPLYLSFHSFSYSLQVSLLPWLFRIFVLLHMFAFLLVSYSILFASCLSRAPPLHRSSSLASRFQIKFQSNFWSNAFQTSSSTWNHDQSRAANETSRT